MKRECEVWKKRQAYAIERRRGYKSYHSPKVTHAFDESVTCQETMETLFSKAIGKCPEADVIIGGVKVCCLLDTGAQVSTMTERFYRENFRD